MNAKDVTRLQSDRSLRPRRAGLLRPAHPDRVCWGCEKLCSADSLACGNGTIRTLHPLELFGDDWAEWFEREDTK